MNCVVLDYGKTVCDKDWDSIGTDAYFYKLYYCIDGKAEYICDGIEVDFLPGNLYIIKENTKYKVVASEGHYFDVLWFHVDFYLPLIKPLVEIKIDENSVEKHLLEALMEAIKSNKEILPKIIEPLTEIIITNNDLFEVFDRPTIKAAQYITKNYNKNITNDTIAEQLGYNKNYFIKKFKDTLGVSPHQYLIKVKMTYAKKYLAEKKSVKQASSIVGYNDPNTFSRDFKKYYGYSPTEFLKSSRRFL